MVEAELAMGGRGGAAEHSRLCPAADAAAFGRLGPPRPVGGITAAKRPLSWRPYRGVAAWHCWRAAELYGGAAESAITR